MKISKLIKLSKFLKDNDLNNENLEVNKITKEAFTPLFWLAKCFLVGCKPGESTLNLIFNLSLDGNPWHDNGKIRVHATLPGTIEKVTKKFSASQDNQEINSLLYRMNAEGYFSGREIPSEYYTSSPKIADNLDRDHVLNNFKLSYYIIRFENNYGSNLVDKKSVMYHDQTGLINSLEELSEEQVIEHVGGNYLYPNNAWMMDEVYVFSHSNSQYQIHKSLRQRSEEIFKELEPLSEDIDSFQAFDF